MRLSNSAIDMYSLCPQKYKLHYIDKIRSEYVGSALLFGGAIDSALNIMLLEKKKELTDDEKDEAKLNPTRVFLDKFRTAEINGKKIDVLRSPQVYYYKSDCDFTVLNELDYNHLIYVASENKVKLESVREFARTIQELKKNKVSIENKVELFYNYICWYCVAKKGIMFLDAYREQVIPRIQEVHSLQREVMLPNGQGDYILGYVDLEATLTDGVRYVLDNKTASVPYSNDSVSKSQQLTIYSEYCENRNCGYIVLNKRLRKKEPRVRIQFILDVISDKQVENIFDIVGDREYNIKAGNFDGDLNNCFHWGRLCPYYNYCRSGSVEGLIKLKDDK
jgi:hypothetical protein